MASRRKLLRWVLGPVALLLILVAAALLVLRSQRFHRYLIALIVEKAQQATGGRVELGDFGFRWSGLRVDLYRLALHGTEPDPRVPLLWVDHVALGLRLGSWRGTKVYLNDAEIDHPVIHFLLDARGQTNLPHPPPSKPSSKPVDVFDLAVRSVALNRGEIYDNDEKTPLMAVLRYVWARITFDPLAVAYNASLRYRQARIQYGTFNPFEHALEMHLTAARSGLNLESLLIKSGSSWVKAEAQMQGYSNPSIRGSYQASLSTTELRRLVKTPGVPAGELKTEATVSYQQASGRPLLDSLSVAGKFSSPALAVSMPQAKTSIHSIAGAYRLERGALELSNLQAEVLGGRVSGRVSVVQLSTTPRGQAEVTVHDLSLAAARQALRSPPPAAEAVNGRLNATALAKWRGSFENLQVRSDASVSGSITTAPQTGHPPEAFPLEAAAHLTYEGSAQTLALQNSYLRTPHTNLSMDGKLGERANLAVQMHSDDLRELDLLAVTFEAGAAKAGRAPSAPPQPLGLAGVASFSATVSGRLRAPQIAGQLSATRLQYHGANLLSLRTNVNASPSGVAFHQGELRTSTQGHASFDISAGLRDWALTPQSPITGRLVASRLPLDDLEHIAGRQDPVTGLLSANLNFTGTETNPAGQGSLQVVQATAWDQPIQNLTAQFRGAGKALNSTVNVSTAAGSANATLSYDFGNEAYTVQLRVPGVRLEQLRVIKAQKQPISGLVRISASGNGIVKKPQLEATVEAPKLQVGQQNLDGLRAEAGVANQQATFKVAITVSGASLEAHGAVNLTGDYQATANIDTQQIQLGPLLVNFLSRSGPGLQGQTQIHGYLKGPLKDPTRVEAQVQIPTLSLMYQKLQIANAAPIHIDYRRGTVALQPAEFKGTDTDLKLEATVPIQGSGALKANANGSIDLHLIKVLSPQYDSAGKIILNVAAQGDRAHPDIRGTIRLANAALALPDVPLGLEKLNGELDLANGRISVKDFSGQLGGGALTVQGFATYQPSVQFNLALKAERVRLLYPDGVRTLFTNNLSLTGTPEAALLNGQVVVNRLSFTKSFDLATFADQFSGQTSAPAGGMAENVKLDIAVTSSGEFALASSQLSVQGSANLRVQGTAANPVIVGRTELSDGELFFQGRRYEIQSGNIQFVNPVQTQAVVNLLVTTTVSQFNIALHFIGPLDRLQTTYTSDPPLAPVDIINLLITGQTTEAAQSTPTTPQSLVAKGISGQVSGQLQKLTGISSLTIDPQIGGNQGNAASQLAIQQRVTKNLFFTFATDVTTTQGELVQVEYQITPRYSMSAIRDQTGGYQLQIKVRKRF